jgi:hypothetical protein
MSKMKYKLEVFYSDTKQVRVSSDVERMAPEMLPLGNSNWTADNWDENFRSSKLIRAIGEKKKFGFFTPNDNTSDFWWHRYQNGKQIELLQLKVLGNGFTKKVHLYEAKVIPASMIPLPMKGKWCVGYTLQFNDSDISDSWSLNN